MDFENESERHEQPDLVTTLDALARAEEGNLSATIFYGLSNLPYDDALQVRPVWDRLPSSARRKILREMIDLSEANFEMDFGAIGWFGLDDADSAVREASIEVLWEDESTELMNRLIEMVQWDEVPEVRAAAASAIGRFVLLGELGDIPESAFNTVQEAVVNVLTNLDEDVDVRRRALEAIANSSHEIVEEAIQEAYTGDERRMQVSAVFAMGRSCDPQWSDYVLRELTSDDPEMRYEAARAAGELEVAEAVPHLTRLALDSDREVQDMAIWSLGEIGGKEALRVLSAMAKDAEDQGDRDLREAIDDAIATANLASGSLSLFDFDQDER